MFSSRWLTAWFAPCPIDTMAITAAMPIDIPSIVSMARSLCLPRAFRAVRMLMVNHCMFPTPETIQVSKTLERLGPLQDMKKKWLPCGSSHPV
jgi:hypothetical protein